MLAKLGCKDLLDLALLVPKGYESHILSSNLHDSPFVAEVHILSYQLMGQKSAQIRAFLPLFDCETEIVIFHPKPYHAKQFQVGSKHIISGRRDAKSISRIIQPKVLTESGHIMPVLPRLKGISNKKIWDFFRSSITVDQLITYQIPLKYAIELQKIYAPTKEFLMDYHGKFSDSTLKALKFLEIFRYLLRLRTKKRYFPARSLNPRHFQSFIRNLPFSLTQGQIKTIEDIYHDLKGSAASRRVVMGDVGCGKSLVMFATAFMVYPKRSLIMAPTFLLAKQLFDEARKYLPDEISIVLVHGGKKSQAILDAHLVIGTHALLWQDVGLIHVVMIDEQHRFGVGHRNYFLYEEQTLFQDNKTSFYPHTFQFSATPIPRTLAMIESSFVNFSIIKERPFVRDVQTQVIKREDFNHLLRHLKAEVMQGHQAAIVYPLVSESQNLEYRSLEEAESFWRKHFEHVFVTHGKDKEKDSVLMAFKEKGEVLLSTTIIEVGISLPRLCTIVVVGAERFGLATLHQLRGRVSRNGLKGYCYLFTHKEDSKRLEAFCSCEDGFEVAELDLRMRKAGDILGGERQSGEEFKFFDLASDKDVLLEAKSILEFSAQNEFHEQSRYLD